MKIKKPFLMVFIWSLVSLFIACPETTDPTNFTPEYTVIFIANGGSPVPKNQNIKQGGKIVMPSDMTRIGYSFDGWYKEATLINLWNFDTDTVTGNINLYAKWNITPIENTEITITAPVKGMIPATTATGTGNFSIGTVLWSPSDNIFKGDEVYTATVTLTANSGYTFTESTNVTINGLNATISETPGTTITLSHTFAATFTKVVTGITIQSQPNKLTYTHDENLDLTGLFITLTYDDYSSLNDVSAANFTFYNITTAPPSNIKLVHSTHDGQSVSIISDSITNNTNNLTVNKADGITVSTPTLNTNTHNSITINAVSASNEQSVEYGINTSDTVPTSTSDWQDGTTFNNLTTETPYYFFARAKESDNYKVGTASVSLSVTLCTVTFNLNGGSGTVPTVQTITAGSGITLPNGNGLSKNGYVFGGWNTSTDGSGINYNASSSYIPNTSITLYAKWEYTVTFNANNGSGTTPSAQTVNPGSSIILPSGSGLSRSGYIFNGWNTSADGMGTNCNANSTFTPNASITLYAKWNVSIYTITFNANGASGTGPASKNVPTGYSSTLPNNENLTLTSASFTGWNTNADGSGINYAAGSNYTPTGNIATITLYAQWDVLPFASVTGFANKLSWLQAHAQKDTSTNYIIEATSDENIRPQTLSYGRNGITITLKGNGVNRAIILLSNGAMFTINSGVTLILDNNIILRGRDGNNGNNNSLIRVDGGTLIMNSGSTITGNSYISNSSSVGSYNTAYGGGVYIASGSFVMNGGTISGNISSASYGSSDNTAYGGGVYMASGTFTMNGGTISDNTSSASYSTTSCYPNAYGGGVYMSGGTFTMSGGTISNNTVSALGGSSANSYGGGVYVSSGTFSLSNGTITGNTSSTTTGTNINRTSFSLGGGVCISSNGTFRMSGGTISGNTSTITSSTYASPNGGGVYAGGTFDKTGGTIYGTGEAVNSNMVKIDNTIQSNSGHAVYGGNRNSVILRRETTAGPDVNIYCSGNSFSGGWEF